MKLTTINKMKKTTCTIGILLGLLFFSAPAFAGDSGVVNVSARVLGRLSQTFVQQQATLNLNPEDIAKGYIDVPAATVMTVNTNAREGYFLHVGMQNLIREVVVTVNGRSVEVSNGGGMVRQPGSNLKQKTLQISYRLYLTDGIVAGTYAWPVSISASLI